MLIFEYALPAEEDVLLSSTEELDGWTPLQRLHSGYSGLALACRTTNHESLALPLRLHLLRLTAPLHN